MMKRARHISGCMCVVHKDTFFCCWPLKAQALHGTLLGACRWHKLADQVYWGPAAMRGSGTEARAALRGEGPPQGAANPTPWQARVRAAAASQIEALVTLHPRASAKVVSSTGRRAGFALGSNVSHLEAVGSVHPDSVAAGRARAGLGCLHSVPSRLVADLTIHPG